MKETGTNLFLLIILASIGGVTGDLIFVFFGKKMKENINKEPNKKILDFFKRQKDSFYLSFFIFLYATFFPMPNEVMTLVLGYLKYPIKRFIIPLTIGNIFYFSILIYIGGSIWSYVF
jgi:membrane protein DedA with SNARE-associated domain